MKKNLRVLLITIIVIAFGSDVMADSPVTSTEFSFAYADIDIVKKAGKLGVLNDEIANFLLSGKNSIDKKAAVCNALSWDLNGKNNAGLFSGFLAKKYNSTIEMLDMDDLSADELLCLGYLKVLDNYFEPKPALIILEKAKSKNKKSFTIQIIYALVQSQIFLNENTWCKIWQVCTAVRNNKSLNKDMRIEAVDAIFEYIDIYKAEC